MSKIDISAVPVRKGTGYPPEFRAVSAERLRQRLGDAGQLTAFGVNLTRLPLAIGRASATGILTRTNSSTSWRERWC